MAFSSAPASISPFTLLNAGMLGPTLVIDQRFGDVTILIGMLTSTNGDIINLKLTIYWRRETIQKSCVFYWSWSSLWSLIIKDDLKSPSSLMLCLSPLTPRRSGKASPSTLPSILEIIDMTRGLNPTWGGDRGRPRKLGFDDSLPLSWKALAVRWWWWCWSPL